MLLVMIGLFATTVLTRVPVEITVERDRQQLYLETDDGRIDNVYSIHLANKSREATSFVITAEGMDAATLTGEQNVTLLGGEIRKVNIRLSAAVDALGQVSTPLRFTVSGQDDPSLSASAETRFIGPSK